MSLAFRSACLVEPHASGRCEASSLIDIHAPNPQTLILSHHSGNIDSSPGIGLGAAHIEMGWGYHGKIVRIGKHNTKFSRRFGSEGITQEYTGKIAHIESMKNRALVLVTAAAVVRDRLLSWPLLSVACFSADCGLFRSHSAPSIVFLHSRFQPCRNAGQCSSALPAYRTATRRRPLPSLLLPTIQPALLCLNGWQRKPSQQLSVKLASTNNCSCMSHSSALDSLLAMCLSSLLFAILRLSRCAVQLCPVHQCTLSHDRAAAAGRAARSV